MRLGICTSEKDGGVECLREVSEQVSCELRLKWREPVGYRSQGRLFLDKGRVKSMDCKMGVCWVHSEGDRENKERVQGEENEDLEVAGTGSVIPCRLWKGFEVLF